MITVREFWNERIQFCHLLELRLRCLRVSFTRQIHFASELGMQNYGQCTGCTDNERTINNTLILFSGGLL